MKDSPQFTKIPNFILDNIASFEAVEFAVLMLICRQTFGWHRPSATLSISFIMKATKFSNRAVISSIFRLTDRGVLLRKKSGDSFNYSIVFTSEPSSLDPVNSVHSTSEPSSLQTAQTSEPSSLDPVNSVHTKKERVKEIEVKENTNPQEPEPASPVSVSAEEIYQAYPLKVGKPKALAAIDKKMKSHDGEFLLNKTKQFSDIRGGDLEFVPHPTTWFNQERFLDSPETWRPRFSGKKPSGEDRQRKEHIVGKTLQ